MKSLICSLVLILSTFWLKAQTYPIPQNLGSPTTLVQNPNYGGFKGGLIPYTFADTSAANTGLTYLKNYGGAFIYTTTPPAIWYRYIAANQWIQILPAGGGSGDAGWTLGGNLLIPRPDSAVLGSLDNEDWYLISNNLKFLKLNKGGIQANTAAVVNLGVNMTTGDLSFGSSAASSVPISGLTAATGTNDIDNISYQQTWRWDELSQFGLVLGATTTAAINGSSLFSAGVSGANAVANRRTIAGLFQNNHSGTNSTNEGIRIEVGSGTQNYAGVFLATTSATTNSAIRLQAVNATNNHAIHILAGDIIIDGSTSGTITMQPQAAAGTYNWNWPTSAGTSGQPLLSGGGSSTAMSFGTLGVGGGGTGLTSYTSGGIPYANSTSTLASSALLAANALMIGGGAGAAPSTLTTGASNTYLGVSGGNPTWITASDAYTSSSSNETNCTVTFNSNLRYLRNGNSVTVYGEVNIDPTANTTQTSFDMTLPIVPPSNFESESYAGGTGWARSLAGSGFAVYSTNGANTVTISFVSVDTTDRVYNFSFTYFIFE